MSVLGQPERPVETAACSAWGTVLCSEVFCHEAFVHRTCPLERRFLCVVLFLMGTFISKSASGEAGEEVLSVVGDEMEFHEGRGRFCAACS